MSCTLQWAPFTPGIGAVQCDDLSQCQPDITPPTHVCGCIGASALFWANCIRRQHPRSHVCTCEGSLPCNWPSMPPRASKMPEDICSAPDVASASSCMSSSVRFPKLSCMWYMQMLRAAGTCESLSANVDMERTHGASLCHLQFAWSPENVRKELQDLHWQCDQ